MVKIRTSPIGRQTAFTLLELLVVLAIIALGSIIIIPSIGNTDAKIFYAQIRELSAVLKYSRRNAVITGQPQISHIFPHDNNLVDKNTIAVKKGDWRSRGAIIEWLNKEKNHLSQQLISIQFFPQGGATGGTLLIKQDQLQVQLIIDSFTGKLTIKEEV